VESLSREDIREFKAKGATLRLRDGGLLQRRTIEPLNLGILVSAFGRSTEENHPSKYFNLVDSLIISDNDYVSTVKGMECIILQAKCYLDIGQPRRAWLTYRRGIAMTQLMVSILLYPFNVSADLMYCRDCNATTQASQNIIVYVGHVLGRSLPESAPRPAIRSPRLKRRSRLGK
jgi:hypothetical protein